jgi:hypothetical protein
VGTAHARLCPPCAGHSVDIGLRPRHATEGAEINLYPFTKRAAEWLGRNADYFKGSIWSRQDRCLQLSDLDTLSLHRVVEMIEEAGLKVRFYGRLQGWDGKSPIWRELMRD